MSTKITTLVENKAGENRSLGTQHGLSYLIEKNSQLYLFDLGQNDLFLKNAKILGYDLSRVNKVFISHNHYDHGGGLRSLINSFTPRELFVHKDFFWKKYGVNSIKKEYLGSGITENALQNSGIKVKKISGKITYIDDGIFLAGDFVRETDFEKNNPRFYVKKGEEFTIDNFRDEIAVGIETPGGLILLLGCSHPGVVNMVRSTLKTTGKDKIYAILGGTHLVEGGEKRINETLNYFQSLDVDHLGFSHCTGEKAEKLFAEKMTEKFFYNNTGSMIEVN